MKKVFKLQNLDCAHCASLMETNIAKLNGVTACTVNFIMQKLTVEIADGVDVNALLKDVKQTVKKVEPDCEIVGL